MASIPYVDGSAKGARGTVSTGTGTPAPALAVAPHIAGAVFFPLVQTQPLFAVVLSAVFLRQLEVVTRWTLLGSCITVGGAVLVIAG